MQKITLSIVCFLLLIQWSVEANKTAKQDRGVDLIKTYDGEENENGKGQRQKIHHERIVTAGRNDSNTTGGADGITSLFQSRTSVPLQTPYLPQGGGSGGYGGSIGNEDAV